MLPFSDPGVLKTGVPATTFTSPQVSSVGLSEAQAREQYGDNKVAVAFEPLSHVDRAICEGQTDGFFKIVYDARKGTILGATIVAPAAGEMINEITLAMEAKFPFDKLAKVMHAYPTFGMAMQLAAADVYYEKTMRLKWLYDILKKLGL